MVFVLLFTKNGGYLLHWVCFFQILFLAWLLLSLILLLLFWLNWLYRMNELLSELCGTWKLTFCSVKIWFTLTCVCASDVRKRNLSEMVSRGNSSTEDDTEDFTMTPGDVIDQEIVLDENGGSLRAFSPRIISLTPNCIFDAFNNILILDYEKYLLHCICWCFHLTLIDVIRKKLASFWSVVFSGVLIAQNKHHSWGCSCMVLIS